MEIILEKLLGFGSICDSIFYRVNFRTISTPPPLFATSFFTGAMMAAD
jgi:hypothetical protein